MVHICFAKSDGKAFFAKIIDKSKRSSPVNLSVLSDMKHEFIAPFVTSFEAQNFVVLLFEYVAGLDLVTRSLKDRIFEDEAKVIFLQVAKV